jgi:hypothetical protein
MCKLTSAKISPSYYTFGAINKKKNNMKPAEQAS